jgi:hypothetical protein
MPFFVEAGFNLNLISRIGSVWLPIMRHSQSKGILPSEDNSWLVAFRPCERQPLAMDFKSTITLLGRSRPAAYEHGKAMAMSVANP